MKKLLALCALVALTAHLAACQDGNGSALQPEPTPTTGRVFLRYENEVAFNMLYPDGWRADILREGIILFADSDAAADSNGFPERSFVVYRRLFDTTRTLSENFSAYVESGPLSSGYVSEEGILPFDLGDQDGQQVLLVTDPELKDGRPELTLLTAAAQAESGYTYIVTATAPSDSWDEWLPTFRIMLGSFELNE